MLSKRFERNRLLACYGVDIRSDACCITLSDHSIKHGGVTDRRFRHSGCACAAGHLFFGQRVIGNGTAGDVSDDLRDLSVIQSLGTREIEFHVLQRRLKSRNHGSSNVVYRDEACPAVPGRDENPILTVDSAGDGYLREVLHKEVWSKDCVRHAGINHHVFHHSQRSLFVVVKSKGRDEKRCAECLSFSPEPPPEPTLPVLRHRAEAPSIPDLVRHSSRRRKWRNPYNSGERL